ncbi:MAG: TIGR02594 family protein [Polyangiaceae bacterium]
MTATYVNAGGELRWMENALRELGVREVPGAGNNPRILEYHRVTTLKATTDATPWCAAFTCFVLESVGIKSTRSAAARSYLTWGTSVQPFYGSIVVFKRDEAGPAAGHVGFCIGPAGGSLAVLSGNQDDSVCVQLYPVTDLLDARWPV